MTLFVTRWISQMYLLFFTNVIQWICLSNYAIPSDVQLTMDALYTWTESEIFNQGPQSVVSNFQRKVQSYGTTHDREWLLYNGSEVARSIARCTYSGIPHLRKSILRKQDDEILKKSHCIRNCWGLSKLNFLIQLHIFTNYKKVTQLKQDGSHCMRKGFRVIFKE